MITNNLGRNLLGYLKLKKVACVIVSTDFRFDMMARCAERSFKKFHPDVDTYLVTPENLPLFPISCQAFYNGTTGGAGPLKYYIAKELMSNLYYTKVICLGADTIVCDRLTEFMDDDESHVIATSDANSQLKLELAYAKPTLEHYELREVGDSKRFFATQQNISPWIKKGTSVTHDDVKNNKGINTLPAGTIFVPQHGEVPDDSDSMHLNADVICFNADAFNVAASADVLLPGSGLDSLPEGREFLWGWKDNFLTLFNTLHRTAAQIYGARANLYNEQGLVNTMLFAAEGAKESFLPKKAFEIFDPYIDNDTRDYMFDSMWINAPWRVTIIDVPYGTSDCLYNIRSLYEDDAELSKDQVFDRASGFYVKNGKLYNRHDKQIKVFHYRDSLQYLGIQKMGPLLEKWRSSFSDDVRSFFIDSCDCKEFFTTDLNEWMARKIIDSRNALGNIR